MAVAAITSSDSGVTRCRSYFLVRTAVHETCTSSTSEGSIGRGLDRKPRRRTGFVTFTSAQMKPDRRRSGGTTVLDVAHGFW
jgi:hypothetical protein